MTMPLKSNLQIQKKIGEGHFGEVYEAIDEVHGKVAVKIMSEKKLKRWENWPEKKASLLSEAKNLKQATHKHVVPVYSLLEADDGKSVQLVMEFCDGGSLQDIFEKRPMTISEVFKIATEIGHGINALHGRGMLHRDIKPANILLDKNKCAKLADFGLVTDNILLGYASQAGYSDHLAYETWHQGGTSVKTDVWAFGMTLYRMLHGKVWYERMPVPKEIIEHGGFAKKLPWLPHVPSSWRRFLRKTMHDDSNARFQTIDQVLSAVAKLPASPSWKCKVSDNSVRWKRKKGVRKLHVHWNQLTAQKHGWKAWSEPINGAGRSMTLGASNGDIARRFAISEMENFFSKSK